MGDKRRHGREQPQTLTSKPMRRDTNLEALQKAERGLRYAEHHLEAAAGDVGDLVRPAVAELLADVRGNLRRIGRFIAHARPRSG